MSSSWIENGAPARRQLVAFGVMIAAALALLTTVRVWRKGLDEIAITSFIVAALFAASAVIAPAALASAYRWWMRLAAALGWINTRILLIAIFYLVVTPVGLIMRIVRRSPLDVARKDSYWTEPLRNSYGDRHYEKQF